MQSADVKSDLPSVADSLVARMTNRARLIWPAMIAVDRIRGIEAVAVDLDGVIRHWPPEPVLRIEREHGMEEGSILAVAFEPDRLQQAIRGQISDEAWRRGIAATLEFKFGAAARPAVDRWSALGGIVDREVIRVLQRVRKSVPVGLLTNATTRLHQDLERHGLHEAFDAVVNSAELGVVKPEAAAFEAAARALDCPLDSVLLIEDQPAHVAAAHTLGMPAMRYLDVADLRRQLRHVGVL